MEEFPEPVHVGRSDVIEGSYPVPIREHEAEHATLVFHSDRHTGVRRSGGETVDQRLRRC